jgi:hypothetical protein
MQRSILVVTVLLPGMAAHGQAFTPKVKQSIRDLYNQAKPTFYFSGINQSFKTEYYFMVLDGDPGPIVKGSDSLCNLKIPNEAIAIFHSHPNGGGDRPSANDIKVARQHGIPVYVVSRNYLYMASPAGVVLRIGLMDVTGNLQIATAHILKGDLPQDHSTSIF